MNSILIRGLEIRACHGVHDDEKVNPQRFVFDADIYYDFSAAAEGDDLAETISYSEVCALIRDAATKTVYNLIETLARECALSILEKFPASGVKVTVYKPDAPVKMKFDRVGVTVELHRERALLSLGSSIGDRKFYIDAALHKLNNLRGVKLLKISSMLVTDPVGGVAKNKFLNCAAEIETVLPPHALLAALQKIENDCGRTRTVKWEDRTLDIDIIFYGDKIVRDGVLTLPHPYYRERDFVLTPLKEIAPDFLCPLTLKRLKDM